jgi:hypothetical protein
VVFEIGELDKASQGAVWAGFVGDAFHIGAVVVVCIACKEHKCTELDRAQSLGAQLAEQLSNVVDLTMRNDQAATFSSCVVVSSSVTLMPSLNFTPASTSATSSWPLNRRQRSCADSSSL